MLLPGEVICPYCDTLIDLYDEAYFKDDLHDDSGSTYIECSCGKKLPIETDATYTFEIDQDAIEE